MKCAFRRILIVLLAAAGWVAELSAAEPTVQTSNLRTVSKTCTTITLRWTSGNGFRRTIIVRKSNPVSAVPADGTVYNANAKYGVGDQIATGEYIVYNLIGTSVTVTGLDPNSNYYFSAFENDGAVSPDYLTASPATHLDSTHWLKPDFTFSYTDSCQNTNVVSFTNKSQASFTISQYSWDFGGGKKSGQQDPAQWLNKPGVNYIKLSVVPNMGCPDSFIIKSVRIVPVPIMQARVNDTIQCFRGNFFTVTRPDSIASVAGFILQYLWDFGDGTFQTLPKPTKVYDKPGTYRVKHKAQILTLIAATNCMDSGYFTFKVLPDPSGNMKINDSVQCLAGNDFQFDNPTANLVSFSWDFGDGNSSNTKLANHTYATTGQYRIIHSATDIESCTGIDTNYVWVKPNFDASFSIPKDTFCHKEPSVALTPLNSGGIFYGSGVSGSTFTPSLVGSHDITYAIRDTFCPDSVIKKVEVIALPSFTLGPDAVECSATSYTLNAPIAGTYLWSTGSSAPSINVSQNGNYWLEVKQAICAARDTIDVFIGSNPQVTFPQDTTLCKGNFLLLRATWPKSTYNWSSGTRDSTYIVTGPGTYSVTVTNPCGTDTKQVNVYYLNENCNLFVPNAFSPNGDGRNEFFEIFGRNIRILDLSIYNRWGELVFRSAGDSSTPIRWDGTFNGKPCPTESYVWKLTYETPFGKAGFRTYVNGTVQLLR